MTSFFSRGLGAAAGEFVPELVVDLRTVDAGFADGAEVLAGGVLSTSIGVVSLLMTIG